LLLTVKHFKRERKAVMFLLLLDVGTAFF